MIQFTAVLFEYQIQKTNHANILSINIPMRWFDFSFGFLFYKKKKSANAFASSLFWIIILSRAKRCRRVATLGPFGIGRTIYASETNKFIKKMQSQKKKHSAHIHIMEMENKYLDQINEMRRMHQTSIDIKRLVFSSFGAISQYYECIIRFLLLCVMNWASRTKA